MDRPVGAGRPGRGSDSGTNPFPPVRSATPPHQVAQRPGRAEDFFPGGRPARPGDGNGGDFRPPGRPGGPGGPGGKGGGRPPVGPKLIDYPRWNKTGFRRWIPSWKLVLGICLLGFIMMVVAFTVAYAATDVPQPDKLVSAQTTTVKFAGDKDSAPEIGKLAVQNRKSVTIDQIPKSMQDAMISAEDRTFRSNSGVSPTGILRAAWNNLRGGSTQGGSTITQQYVKNSFDMRDRTITRKAKEFFIALKINRTMDKDQVLEDYLNTIYFGRGAYGIQAASQAYFKKDVGQLDVSQAAFLAGIVKGPSIYDPLKSETAKAGATARWNYVLDGMVTMGSLDATTRASLKFPTVVAQQKSVSRSGYYGYLMQMVEDEASKMAGLSESDLERGGYTIYTTFDKRLMDESIKAVNDELYDINDLPKGTEAGMATINPKTGAVMSIYGGSDALKHPFNNATQATMQAGSTFKPFTLIAALRDGISLKSYYNGDSPKTVDGFDEKVKNFGGEDWGNINLIKATANSVNTVYAQLNEGRADETRKVAIAAGVPEDTQDLLANPANVLGTASPHVIDMASAYATIAAGGVHHQPFVIQSIAKPDGGLQYQNTTAAKGDRAFDPDVIADATYAMQQVVEQGSGSYAQRLGREVAGKTGTSTSSYSAWFNGFTPQMVTTVGLFRDVDGKQQEVTTPAGKGVTGGSYPVRIWTAFMKEALNKTPEVKFPDPVYGGEVENSDLKPTPKYTSTPTDTGSSSPTSTGQPTTTSEPTQTETGPTIPTITFPGGGGVGVGGGGNQAQTDTGQ